MGDLPMRLQEEVSYEEMHKIITQVINGSSWSCKV